MAVVSAPSIQDTDADGVAKDKSTAVAGPTCSFWVLLVRGKVVFADHHQCVPLDS